MASRLRDMLASAKKRKQAKDRAFDRSSRTTYGPLTDEARDWAVNNAGERKRRELEKKITNPIKRKQMEKEWPITTMNRSTGSFHSSENEARLNSNSREQYNQLINRTTAMNTLRGYNNRKKGTK